MPRVLRVVSIVAVVLALLGCPPAKVSVPNVLGMTEVSATAAIIAAQLVVGDVTAAYSENVAIGSVVSQNPAGGQKASPGSTVALILSLGPAPLVGWSYVPGENSVLGLTINNTADGGCIVSGGHDSTYDMYVLKLTASGLADWDMIYSYISSEGGHPELWGHEASGAAETADGGYIVLGAGRVDGDGLPDESYLLVKSDEAGNVAWSKSYAPDNPYSPGHYCVNNAPAALQITGDGAQAAGTQEY